MNTKTLESTAGVGLRIREKRKILKLSQKKLAGLVGTTPSAILKIESGKSLRPRKIDEIAKALNTNPAWLLFGDEYATITKESLELANNWSRLPQTVRRRIKKRVEDALKKYSV